LLVILAPVVLVVVSGVDGMGQLPNLNHARNKNASSPLTEGRAAASKAARSASASLPSTCTARRNAKNKKPLLPSPLHYECRVKRKFMSKVVYLFLRFNSCYTLLS
jgi:hypothetical protein